MTPADQQHILNAAMQLPPEDRAEIAERLWASLDDQRQAEVQRTQIEESQRRMEAYRKGQIRSIDGDEVMERLREGQRP